MLKLFLSKIKFNSQNFMSICLHNKRMKWYKVGNCYVVLGALHTTPACFPPSFLLKIVILLHKHKQRQLQKRCLIMALVHIGLILFNQIQSLSTGHISRVWIKLTCGRGWPLILDFYLDFSKSSFNRCFSEWPKIQLWSNFLLCFRNTSTWTWNFLNTAFWVSNLESYVNRFKKVFI